MSRVPIKARQLCECGRPAGDAFLCKVCAPALARMLRELPERVIEVEDTAYRLDRVAAGGDGSSARGSTRPLPYRPEVRPLLDRARNSVTTAVRDLAESRGVDVNARHPAAMGPTCTGERCEHDTCRAVRFAGRHVIPESFAGMCDWLARRIDSIRLSPGAGDVMVEFTRLTADLLAAIDMPPTPTYLGPCDNCKRPMYVVRGERVHACATRGCEWTYNVDRRVAQLLKESRNVVATATTIATALTSLDTPVTEERIWKWRQRGKLALVKSDAHGRPMYRVGDVLDLLEAEQRRAVTRAVAKHIGVSR